MGELVVVTEQSPQPRAVWGQRAPAVSSTQRPGQGGQVSGAGQVHLVAVQTHCQLASYI